MHSILVHWLPCSSFILSGGNKILGQESLSMRLDMNYTILQQTGVLATVSFSV